MSQSKLVSLDPLLGLGRSYNNALRRNPLLVKSLTSCVLGALGNYLAQRASKPSSSANQLQSHVFIKKRSILAFAALGLGLFGPVGHFWLNFLDRYGPSHPLLKLILDRLGYGPLLLLVTLYLLPILEGSSPADAAAQVRKTFLTALKMNLKVWIIVMYVNLNFVPLPYRVLVTNLASVGWHIYLSKTREKAQSQKTSGKSKQDKKTVKQDRDQDQDFDADSIQSIHIE